MDKMKDKQGRFKNGHAPIKNSFNRKPHVSFDRLYYEEYDLDDTPDYNPINRQTDDRTWAEILIES